MVAMTWRSRVHALKYAHHPQRVSLAQEKQHGGGTCTATSKPCGIRIDSIEQAVKNSGLVMGPMNDVGYRVGYAIAEDNLRAGLTVIADSVNPIQTTRDQWIVVAKNTHQKAVEVELKCSDSVEHQHRVETRVADNRRRPARGRRRQVGGHLQNQITRRNRSCGIGQRPLVENEISAAVAVCVFPCSPSQVRIIAAQKHLSSGLPWLVNALTTVRVQDVDSTRFSGFFVFWFCFFVDSTACRGIFRAEPG